MSFRDTNFLFQVKMSFVYKVLSIVISFLLVKYMLIYLGVAQYGIWATILTSVNWIIFFDFGITNGVKNKVASCLSNSQLQEAKEYISTGYVVLFLFCFFIFLFFYCISYLVNWQILLNIIIISNKDLQNIMNIIAFFILSSFSLSIITAILNAVQKASLIVIGQFLSQFFSLISLIFLIKFTEASLEYMAFAYGTALVISNLLISFLFYKKNMTFFPSLQNFKKSKVKPIISLGVKFFFLQLTILFILTTDTMIIAHLLGPNYVSTYDVLFKFFGILMTLHTLINAPLWSMYTEAYAKQDYLWIKKMIMRMSKLMLIYLLLAFIMYLYRESIINMWIGNNVLVINKSNAILMLIMVLVLIWYSIFAYFSNGINKTNNQLISATIGAIIHIPLSIYFVSYLDMELNGILLSTILSLSIFGITGPIHAIRIINRMKNEQNMRQEGSSNE